MLENRDYIVQSLILLMNDKAYADITMEDISKKSGLSRRTVYRYFPSKLDILRAYIDGLIQEFWAYVSDELRRGENIIERCFEFIGLHFDFFKAAYRNNLMINIMSILRHVIEEVVRYSNPDLYSSHDAAYLDNYVAYIAGGCWGLLCHWINMEKRAAPHEMYRAIKNIAHDLNARMK